MFIPGLLECEDESQGVPSAEWVEEDDDEYEVEDEFLPPLPGGVSVLKMATKAVRVSMAKPVNLKNPPS